VILVQEAGGKVTDFEGGKDYIFGRHVVATNHSIHKELMGVIAAHWA
jgi:myo-inositol-1(or 4)-monophosphatase